MEIINRNERRINRNSAPVAGLETARVPPQAVDVEEAVLGGILLEREAIHQVGDLLRSDMFYVPQHQLIYEAIQKLYEGNHPIDALTVTTELRKMNQLENAGGAFKVATLTNSVGNATNIEFHARIIAEKFIRRELIRIAAETNQYAFDESLDVFDLLDKSEDAIFQVAERSIRKNFETMSSLVSKAINELKDLMSKENELAGIPSGFIALDRVTAGWQKSNLVIIAARPGMGKTAFVLSMARNMSVDYKVPIAVFSLEMSGVELVNRLISSETEISGEKLKRGNLEGHEWQQLVSRINKLSEAPIYIDDTPQLSILELRTKCRRLKSKYDIQCVIIDYLQLMTANSDNKKSGNREQEISQISRELKGLAKELSIPVIALSQLSRAVETRPDKRPQLSDLRESGAIEQDADMVMFIYRPEYYRITELDNYPSTAGLAKLIIEKHRNGPTGEVDLRFISHHARFTDYDELYQFDSGNQANNQFDSGALPFKTISSKMNDLNLGEEGFDNQNEVPF